MANTVQLRLRSAKQRGIINKINYAKYKLNYHPELPALLSKRAVSKLPDDADILPYQALISGFDPEKWDREH